MTREEKLEKAVKAGMALRKAVKAPEAPWRVADIHLDAVDAYDAVMKGLSSEEVQDKTVQASGSNSPKGGKGKGVRVPDGAGDRKELGANKLRGRTRKSGAG